MATATPSLRPRSRPARDRALQEILTALMEGTARATGPAFFSSLVEHLASLLDARHAIVGRIRRGERTDRVEALAAWSNGGLVSDLAYDLAGSPCENALEQGICVYPARVCERFPTDTLLREMRAESYVGAALVASPGEPMGVLCVLDDRPISGQRVEVAETILEIFASRAMAEIDRIEAHEKLLEQHQTLEDMLAERTSELAEAHARLDRAARLAGLGTLASGIAHELNNPLGSIRLACEELALDGESEAVRARAIECLVESVERCSETVKGIKRFANDEAAEKTRVDVNACIEAAATTRRRLRASGEVEIVVERLAPNAIVEGNRIQIEQVIDNLLQNAIHAPGTQCVVARSIALPGRIAIEVADDGSGIRDEDLPRIFDPFFTTRLREGGTGLGLSICHSIVEDHGGTIDARRPLEGGTCFRVELPAVKREG